VSEAEIQFEIDAQPRCSSTKLPSLFVCMFFSPLPFRRCVSLTTLTRPRSWSRRSQRSPSAINTFQNRHQRQCPPRLVHSRTPKPANGKLSQPRLIEGLWPHVLCSRHVRIGPDTRVQPPFVISQLPAVLTPMRYRFFYLQNCSYFLSLRLYPVSNNLEPSQPKHS